MVRVKFNDSEATYNVSFLLLPNDVVQLTGDIPTNTSGFKVYRLNDSFLGDYSKHKKIIANLGNGLQFGKN